MIVYFIINTFILLVRIKKIENVIDKMDDIDEAEMGISKKSLLPSIIIIILILGLALLIIAKVEVLLKNIFR